MIFKIESSEVDINGKTVLKVLALAYVTTKLCKAIFKPKQVYYVVVDDETTKTKKEQKISKKIKVESM